MCKIINLTSSITYWADEIEIVSCLASLDWRLLNYLSRASSELQDSETLAFGFYLRCLKSKDGRIRDAALDCTVQFATGLYGPRYIHKVDGPLLNRLELLADGYLQRLFPAQNSTLDADVFTEYQMDIPFDTAAEWMISCLVEELLQSASSNEIAGLSSALLRLLRALPSAQVWKTILSHPAPPIILYLVQLLELHSGIVEWTRQADVVNLTAELVQRLTMESVHETGGFIPEQTVLIQRRFLIIILRILAIMKLVYNETKVSQSHELFQGRDKKTLPSIEKVSGKALNVTIL